MRRAHGVEFSVTKLIPEIDRKMEKEFHSVRISSDFYLGGTANYLVLKTIKIKTLRIFLCH